MLDLLYDDTSARFASSSRCHIAIAWILPAAFARGNSLSDGNQFPSVNVGRAPFDGATSHRSAEVGGGRGGKGAAPRQTSGLRGVRASTAN